MQSTDLYHRDGLEVAAQECFPPDERCALYVKAGGAAVKLHFPDPGAALDFLKGAEWEVRDLLARRSERPPVAGAHSTESNGESHQP
jgi:hypothetical protein